MTISIVTPWTDHPELIPDYVAVVEGADEVLIVDNASSADNHKLLCLAAQSVGGRVIRNETNHFFGPAVNRGMREASGDILITLNNDVSGGGNWLQGARDCVRDGLYGPSLVQWTRAGIPFQYLEGWCVAGLRETWEKLDYFDEAAYPRPLWEDPDLCLRAEIAGIPLIQTDWPIYHKGGTTRHGVPGANRDSLVNEATFIRRLWAARHSVHGGTGRGTSSAKDD